MDLFVKAAIWTPMSALPIHPVGKQILFIKSPENIPKLPPTRFINTYNIYLLLEVMIPELLSTSKIFALSVFYLNQSILYDIASYLLGVHPVVELQI